MDEPRQVTREDVVACYRAFLGRDPESVEVIDTHVAQASGIQDLLQKFLGSAEFLAARGQPMGYEQGVAEVYNVNNYAGIEVDVADDVLARIFARLVEQWTLLGAKEPHWAVLSQEEFRPANIRKNLDSFYSSGKGDLNSIDLFCQRNQVALPRGVCMELGCGVGRVTRYLAQRFDKVIGFDVSEPMVRLARAYLNISSLKNCEIELLRSPSQLEGVEPYQFFYSIIVLQHNPPPVMKTLLRLSLERLTSGGAFLFQVPTHRRDYSFDAAKYLSQTAPTGGGFDMHVLPMHIVMDTIVAAGCQIKEVIADNGAGHPGSHTFFGIKP